MKVFNFDHLLELLFAIVVLIILFTASCFFILNSVIEIVKAKANNLTLSCSEQPSLSASKLIIGKTVFYCVLSETQQLNYTTA